MDLSHNKKSEINRQYSLIKYHQSYRELLFKLLFLSTPKSLINSIIPIMAIKPFPFTLIPTTLFTALNVTSFTFVPNQLSAALPPLIPRQVLFDNPQIANPQLSADAKYLTYVAPDRNNVLQVWIRTLGKTDDRVITADKKRGIRNYFWTYDGSQLVYLQDNDGDENFQMYAVNVKTNKVRNLTPYKGIRAELIATEPSRPNEILVGLNKKDPRNHDAYRIDLRTGKATLVMENPGNIVESVADKKMQIRAAIATTKDGGSVLMVRNNSQQKWRQVRKWSADEEGELVEFSEDGKTLYFKANHNANASRLIALNMNTGKENVIAEDKQYDVTGTLVHPRTRKIQGVAFYKQTLQWQFLDQQVAADFARFTPQIAKNRSEYEISLVDRDLSDRIWLLSYRRDDGSTQFYTYNRTNKQTKFLFSSQPKLDNLALAQMKPMSYTARDGLNIQGYLTTPVGVPAKNLPMVLLVHGGPWSRDVWGYNPMVQWLANRGYAVLQVNFRGSTGYGKEFLNAGNREWGQKMHFDLLDGVNWAAKQGIADPKKVAIMGGSYGGYATLAGVTFSPDVFAAGVSIVGPSNLITLLQSLPPYWESGRAMFYHRVGNLDKEKDFLKSRSPLFFVDRIKTPLLIGQGANDPRVKQAESEQIVTAMRKANKPVEYILYTDEGHGFARPANRLHFYANTEVFLGKYLGGRVEPVGNIVGHSGVVK